MNPMNLLSDFKLGDLHLKNRVVMAPLTRARAGKQRLANAMMAEYYALRASAGLIIAEATTISPRANGWNESPGIYTEEMAKSWQMVTDAVHEKGGLIFLQLWHMGRASHRLFHDGLPPVAPSAIKINGDSILTPQGKMPYEVPHALTLSEIQDTIQDYRQAAVYAKQAGFDGVEIHAANGYLIDQFLQSKTNQRSDEYGGSIANRYRFLSEVVEAVVSVWPSNRVGVRLAPNGVFNDMGSDDFREQFLFTAQQLNDYSLAYLHVMDGLDFGFHGLGEAMTLNEFRAVFSGVLIGNCGYDQVLAEQAVSEGKADLIAFGRPYLSNPDLVERFTIGAALNPMAPMKYWYTPEGAKGYLDYPLLNERND